MVAAESETDTNAFAQIGLGVAPFDTPDHLLFAGMAVHPERLVPFERQAVSGERSQ